MKGAEGEQATPEGLCGTGLEDGPTEGAGNASSLVSLILLFSGARCLGHSKDNRVMQSLEGGAPEKGSGHLVLPLAG